MMRKTVLVVVIAALAVLVAVAIPSVAAATDDGTVTSIATAMNSGSVHYGQDGGFCPGY